MQAMLTWAILSSNLTAILQGVGIAQIDQMDIYTSGMLVFPMSPATEAAPSAQVMLCARTTLFPARRHTLSQNGIQQRILAHHMTTQPAALIEPTGDVTRVTSGKLQFLIGSEATPAALAVSELDPNRGFQP